MKNIQRTILNVLAVVLLFYTIGCGTLSTKPNGERCDANSECQSSFCKNPSGTSGICTKNDLGQTCAVNNPSKTQCAASGFCISVGSAPGICTASCNSDGVSHNKYGAFQQCPPTWSCTDMGRMGLTGHYCLPKSYIDKLPKKRRLSINSNFKLPGNPTFSN